MSVTQCAGCGRDVYGSADTEGYCPDCADWEATQNHAQQSRDLEANQNRHRTIANTRHSGTEAEER